MTRKPVDNKLKNKAFSICLLVPLNNSIYNSTLEIEALLDLLKQANNEGGFRDALQILTRISEHQLVLAGHFADIAKSITIEPEEQQKVH